MTDKMLMEREPGELNIELLSVLQEALMAKLLQTDRELMRRYVVMLEAGTGIPGSEEPLAVIAECVDRLNRVDAVIEVELDRKMKFRRDRGCGVASDE